MRNLKLHIRLLAAALALATLFGSNHTQAADQCASVFETIENVSGFRPDRNKAYENSKLTTEQVDLINERLFQLGIEKVSGTETATVIKKLVENIKVKKLEKDAALDLIGDLAVKIHSKLGKGRDRNKLQIMSSFVDAISEFESWKPTDFKRSNKLAMVAKDVKFVSIQELHEYVESYVKRDDGAYSKIPDHGQGILEVKDIRDAASHNLWVLEMKGHDMKHGHFLLGHPWAANAYFKTARSTLPNRLAIIGGLFEGVDVAQYSWETQITSHFKRSKRMGLEEAMLYVAMISPKKLHELEKQIGLEYYETGYAENYNYGGAVQQYKDYVPSYHAKFPRDGKYGKGLNYDLKEMMEYSVKLLDDPNMAWLTNYRNTPPKGGAKTSVESINTSE